MAIRLICVSLTEDAQIDRWVGGWRGGNEGRGEGRKQKGRKDERRRKLIACSVHTSASHFIHPVCVHLLGILQGTGLSGQMTREMLTLQEEQLWENVILAVGGRLAIRVLGGSGQGGWQ